MKPQVKATLLWWLFVFLVCLGIYGYVKISDWWTWQQMPNVWEMKSDGSFVQIKQDGNWLNITQEGN